MGTSPDPSLNSPSTKHTDGMLNPTDETQPSSTFTGETDFRAKLTLACSIANRSVPLLANLANNHSTLGSAYTSGYTPNSFNWLAQQNGGSFDPMLFGDYREPQDNIISQDFGSFFDDAFPLPDLGSPQHNFNDVTTDPEPAPRADLIQADAVQAGEEHVLSGEDRAELMTCNKIWYALAPPPLRGFGRSRSCRDRLQSMEKFRNGEIDVDNLCSQLRAKARCSEGGAVVEEQLFNAIVGNPQSTS